MRNSWESAARKLPWFRTWDQAFEWNFPTFRWFIGGKTNLSYNALDHHVERGWGGHAAIVYINERGERMVLTPPPSEVDGVKVTRELTWERITEQSL